MDKSEYLVTRDTSRLTEATGFWSGDTVYFNSERNKFVITNRNFATEDINNLINNYLAEKDIQTGHTRFQREVYTTVDNTRYPFPTIFSVNRTIRSHYSLESIVEKINEKPPYSPGIKSTWEGVYKWLQLQNKNTSNQKMCFSHLVFETYNTNNRASDFAYIRGLRLLFHPWLRFNIERWVRHKVPIDCIIEFIANSKHYEELYIPKKTTTCPPDFYDKVGRVTKGIIAIPESYAHNNNHGQVWHKLMLSLQMLLGLMQVRGHIMFPPVYAGAECWHANDIIHSVLNRMWPENWKWDRKDHETLAYRLISSSTLKTLFDIPANIHELISSSYGGYNKYTAPLLTKRLQNFQKEEGLTSFPLKELHGLKARRNKNPVKWSYDWCLKELKLTDDWLKFARIITDNRHRTVEGETNYLRSTLEWAWLERHFLSPADITARDLRDPEEPKRTDTLYFFIKNKTSSHWDIWNRVESAFRIVQQSMSSQKLLRESPFGLLNNPFKTKRRGSVYTTTRSRIPNNIHAAMLHVLLSPDEDGKATYSFAKKILRYDWIEKNNSDTGKPEWVFCPSRTNLLALLLLLPIRKKQASWLDQGLLDTYIWDIDKNEYIPNQHPLKNYLYPSGQTHQNYNGRATGVLQPITDDWFTDDTRCIYINTNKTQMWDPDNKRGYELWWPTSDLLKPDVDIADLTQQKNYLNRPYEIIENQIKWMQIHDPMPEPTTFKDWSDEKIVKKEHQDIELPFFTPIFRDISSPNYRKNGTPYFVPPTKIKLRHLLNAVAVHAEKLLREQYGAEISLTRENPASHSGSSYQKRVCIYDIHSFRVYGISYLMEIGVPLPVVQMIVGHTTPVMTLYYNKMTSGFVHKILSSQLRKDNHPINFSDISEDLLKNNTQYVTRNTRGGNIPETKPDSDYRGFVSRPGGICPVGGLECKHGQETVINDAIQYTSTNGRCGNCRFFCTTPAHLFEHQRIINDLFIQIRSQGKKQVSLATEIKKIQFENISISDKQPRLMELTYQLESLEIETEPLIREWLNRREMATRSAELLDPFTRYLKSRPVTTESNTFLLISSGGKEEIESRIEFNFQKAGEFELVRQSMLGACFSGGISQCNELTRYQMRDFLNSIMMHDNPSHLLFSIADENTRDKVALLMAEAMVTFAGSDTVQHALDTHSGLKDCIPDELDYIRLEDFLNEVFNKAKTQGTAFSIEPLLPHILAYTNETGG